MAVHVQQYCSRCGGIGRYRTTTYNDAIVQIHVCDCAAGQQIIDTEARIQQLERENAGMRNVPKLPHGWNPPFYIEECLDIGDTLPAYLVLTGDARKRSKQDCVYTTSIKERAAFYCSLLNAVYPLPPAPNQEG